MTRRLLAISLLWLACKRRGGEPPSCTATLAGNFADTAAQTCPVLRRDERGHAWLDANITARTKIGISIDLGASPTPGLYRPASVPSWRALGLQVSGKGGCVYQAGSATAPPGDFTLTLAAVDGTAAHGRLVVVLHVLPIMATDCGAVDIETVTIEL